MKKYMIISLILTIFFLSSDNPAGVDTVDTNSDDGVTLVFSGWDSRVQTDVGYVSISGSSLTNLSRTAIMSVNRESFYDNQALLNNTLGYVVGSLPDDHAALQIPFSMVHSPIPKTHALPWVESKGKIK
jgi:fibronectin type 3 domain-containing protein